MLIGHIICFIVNILIAIFCMNQAKKEQEKEDPSVIDCVLFYSLSFLNCISASVNIGIILYMQ